MIAWLVYLAATHATYQLIHFSVENNAVVMVVVTAVILGLLAVINSEAHVDYVKATQLELPLHNWCKDNFC